MVAKKYTLAEAKRILASGEQRKKRAKTIVRKTKSKTRIGGHTVKRVEYLTANPVKRHPVRFVIEVLKKIQFPTDHFYVGKRDGYIVKSFLDAHTYRTEGLANKAAHKLQRSPNLAKDVYAFRVTSIRL